MLQLALLHVVAQQKFNDKVSLKNKSLVKLERASTHQGLKMPSAQRVKTAEYSAACRSTLVLGGECN
jgi:hypothetical protein